MKKSYSYYARIRVPKDINQKFRFKTELRFSLKTNNVTDAKSKARLVAGCVQWVFRNIRNGGQFSVLSDEQIDKLIKDHIKRLLDEDLEFRLESPQHVPKGESHRIMAHIVEEKIRSIVKAHVGRSVLKVKGGWEIDFGVKV